MATNIKEELIARYGTENCRAAEHFRAGVQWACEVMGAMRFCADCDLKDCPPCGKGLPCCKCDEENCNSRQPCPKKGGAR